MRRPASIATLALDLADWILRMEQGWSYAVGADLWVWITLREGDRFNREESLTLTKGAGMKQLEGATSPMYAAVGDAEAGGIARQQEQEATEADQQQQARGSPEEESYCLVEDCYATEELTNDEVNKVT